MNTNFRTLLGVIFAAGGVWAAYKGLQFSTTLLAIFSCYYFIMSELEEIRNKLK